MSRGRHALPEPPRSGAPLLVVTLLLAAATVAAVWSVESGRALQVAVTGLAVVAALTVWSVSRSAREQAERLAAEANERRRDQQRALQMLADTSAQLSELRQQHTELLLELRALRDETEQRALMHELLLPAQVAEPEPVYPSLQLPLVRAAFAADHEPLLPLPTSEEDGAPAVPLVETSGDEPRPPRQLLDLTASEIARLRPAN